MVSSTALLTTVLWDLDRGGLKGNLCPLVTFPYLGFGPALVVGRGELLSLGLAFLEELFF